MLKLGRVLVLGADTKHSPRGCQHGIHRWSRSGEELDQGSDRDSRQRLLDDVVVASKIKLPVQYVNGVQQ